MLNLIILVIFGILAAFFATQNTTPVSITVMNYTIKKIPLHFIVLGSILIGLVLSSVISFVNSLFLSFTIHGKNVKIKETKKTVVELTKQIHQLELENEKLKAKKTPLEIDDKSL